MVRNPAAQPRSAHLDGVAAPESTVEGAWWAWSDSRVVSRLHRLAVGGVARTIPARWRDAALRRIRRLLHAGSRVECPICDSRFRHFMARPGSTNVICWKCDSQERHRTLWLFLDRLRPGLLGDTFSLLHFAPEPGLSALLRARTGRYVTADIEPGRADLALDITNLELPDESFQAIICSHVLEHVPDDRAAMRELHRVLAPGGWVIVMVPIDPERDATYENAAIVTPEERRRHFWQEDHVRLYAVDIADRLTEAGFAVERIRPTDGMRAERVERLRLGLGNDIFLARKP